MELIHSPHSHSHSYIERKAIFSIVRRQFDRLLLNRCSFSSHHYLRFSLHIIWAIWRNTSILSWEQCLLAVMVDRVIFFFLLLFFFFSSFSSDWYTNMPEFERSHTNSQSKLKFLNKEIQHFQWFLNVSNLKTNTSKDTWQKDPISKMRRQKHREK